MSEVEKKPVVAVFDFDGTVTYVDSFLPFLRQIGGFFGFWLGMLMLAPVLFLHAVGALENWRVKERFLGRFLKGKSEEDLAAPAKEFVRRRMPSLINPIAMEKVRWHRERGHRMLLLSASPELYLGLWTEENGFEKVLGTKLAASGGRLTGRIEGRNCHGEEKVVRLREELGELDQYEIYSYGDSRSDKVLLDIVEHGEYRSFEGGSRRGYRIAGLLRFVRALI
jgi:HAD superfamily hydrolase (TIGR01490 family)